MTHLCPVYRAELEARRRHPAFDVPIEAYGPFVEFVCGPCSAGPFRELRARHVPEHAHSIVTIAPGIGTRTRACAYPDYQHIELVPGYAPMQMTLIHEIAHLCSPIGEAHGRLYAANYLELVRYWLGEGAAVTLLTEFRKLDIL